jgi:hypothetical protein
LTVASASRSNSRFLNTRRHQNSQAHMCERASSSASVDDVVTVLCSWLYQSIVPPKSLNMPPSVL